MICTLHVPLCTAVLLLTFNSKLALTALTYQFRFAELSSEDPQLEVDVFMLLLTTRVSWGFPSKNKQATYMSN